VTDLSVIIPTHNRKELTLQAVASVLCQTYSGAECLVIDDGSTDKTAESVREAFPSVRYIRQDHRGVSAARNQGIAEATGLYLAFLDSDDLFTPSKCQRQLEILGTHPEIMLVHTEEIWVRDGAILPQRHCHRRGGGDQFSRSLERCVISPSSVMVHRELFDLVGTFDESMPACEDYDMWLRVTSRFPVQLIPEILVVKRGGHGDQLSRTVPALDYWRLYALVKLIHESHLSAAQRELLIQEIGRKSRIVATGRRKRRKPDAAFYEDLERRCRAGEDCRLPPL